MSNAAPSPSEATATGNITSMERWRSLLGPQRSKQPSRIGGGNLRDNYSYGRSFFSRLWDRIGGMFGGDQAHDLYGVFGWDKTISPQMMWEMYQRNGIAKRLIHVYGDATWSYPPELKGPARWTSAWKKVVATHRLWAVINRLDRLAHLGQYSCLFVGTGGTNLQQPISASTSIEQVSAIITHDPLPHVNLDRSQLVRLFQNLLANAIKFRKAGETPRIHAWAERRDKEWVIRVKDNGIGFSPEYAGAIFAPFKRLHSTRQYPGSGIGLAACKRIVEGWGGQIGAESIPGDGSIFWFTLPAS